MVAGVTYCSFQIRHQTKMRQTDLVIRLYATFITKEFQEAYEKVATIETQDYNDTLKEGYLPRLRTIGGFFEGIGVLLHRKLVDIGLVDALFRESKPMWEKAKPVLYDARKQLNLPLYGGVF